ncbi:MAG: peptidoglycan DD-metalloendopeptidase family protein [Bdellovibrionales bacterium]|nr:peptidoglycan DD-metalloendopeptidase family protein [Bdellovibrionales bacterium]
MKIPLRNDFCLWIVPPNSGKVKKVRFTLRTVGVIALAAILAGGTFTFLASDYTRVQVARFQNYLHLKKVSLERDRLIARKDSLESALTELEQKNRLAVTREQQVQMRIDELASILESASLGGLKDKKDALSSSKQLEDKNSGIGGAEIDCRLGDPTRCEGIDSATGSVDLHVEKQNQEGSKDLVALLDRYLALLKITPFGVPVPGHINSDFGYRRSPFSGSLRMHQGVDFSSSYGGYVYSTADGIVTRVGRNGTYGLMVDIDHGAGVSTRYAHLSKSLVQAGDKICRGEVLGLVGSSGRSTGPHLHYEVRVNGKAKNPMPFIELAEKIGGIFL